MVRVHVSYGPRYRRRHRRHYGGAGVGGLLVGAVAGAAIASAASSPSYYAPPAYAPPPASAPGTYPCSRCRYALTWVPQYGRWYCNYCRMYW
jgi:hypothetical protein